MPEKLSSGPKKGYDLSKVGSGLSRGESRQKKMTTAPWSGEFPAPGATLDLDFANNRGFVRGLGQRGVMDAITFTRASNATYVGPDGLLKIYSNQGALGKNLLTFPQDIDNGAWGKSNLDVAANAAIAPDGTLTADKLSAIASTTTSCNQIATGAGSTAGNIFSVYVKKGSGATDANAFMLRNNTSGVNLLSIKVNYDTLGITYVTGSSGASASEDSNGWIRVTLTATIGISNGDNMRGYVCFVADSETAGEYAFAWGAQLELGSTATTYYPTNIGLPRFDWSATTQVAQRNLLTQTSSYGGWSTSGCTITPNSAVDPDGGNTAATFASTGTNTGSYIWNTMPIGFEANKTYTISFWAKGQLGGEKLRFSSGVGEFNAYDVTLTTSWQKFSFTATQTTSTKSAFFETGTYVYQSTQNTIYLWQPQLELGSTATTYQAIAQPTTSTPLAATSTCNGILIEEGRTNRCLWNRDATTTPSRNYLTYTESLSNSAWSKTLSGSASAPTVSSGFTDPDGGSTAWKITFAVAGTTISDRSILQIGNADGLPSDPVGSVWLKNANSGTVSLSARAGGISTYTTLTVTDTWQRFNFSSATKSLVFTLRSTGDISPASTIDVLFWHPQLEVATTASVYEANNTDTGLIWSKQGITAAKDQTGIDGVANSASSLTATEDNGTCVQTYTTASASYTSSVYLKRLTGTGNVQVSLDGSTYSTVEISNTEWRRIALSGTVVNPSLGIKLATNGDSVAMDFGQIEDGTFATSPILTTSAAVARSADLAFMLGENFRAWFRQDQGAWGIFFDVSNVSSANRYVLQAGKSVDYAMGLGIAATNNHFFGSVVDSTNVNVMGFESAVTVTSYVQGGYSFAQGYKAYTQTLTTANEEAKGTSQPTDRNRLAIGSNANSGQQINGRIKRVIFLPKKLTTSAIEELTR